MGRVLIVDDEASVRDTLADIVVLEGHEVAVAKDGIEALTHLQRARVDAVVIDMRMPNLDGVGFYQALTRRFPELAYRVLFITGQADEGDRRFLAGAGLPWLKKPISMDVLTAELTRILAPRRPV
jgi:CheY-like chemotaxis protein